eukprot:363119-Chlamydomonas_euryale.AAC.3
MCLTASSLRLARQIMKAVHTIQTLVPGRVRQPSHGALASTIRRAHALPVFMPGQAAGLLRPVLQIMMSRRGAAWLGLVPKIWTNAGNVLGVGLN